MPIGRCVEVRTVHRNRSGLSAQDSGLRTEEFFEALRQQSTHEMIRLLVGHGQRLGNDITQSARIVLLYSHSASSAFLARAAFGEVKTLRFIMH